MMSDRIEISFVVRKKGGVSGGKTLSGKIPAFDWESFKNTPNADVFVKKAYIAACRKIIREIDEKKKYQSSEADLSSTEAVIAKSISFTKSEIKDWLESRDWSKASDVQDIEKLLPAIRKRFPTLASRVNPFSQKDAEKLADKVVAAVSDKADAVADFLFTVLTTNKNSIKPEDL